MRRVEAAAIVATFLAAAAPAVAQTPSTEPTAKLFVEQCGECHGPDRLGAMGPALIPESLIYLKNPAATAVITKGRQQTQMPAFGDKLTPAQIDSLVDYIYKPLGYMPAWGEKEIRASRVTVTPPEQLSPKPVYASDPLNLFIVVEQGDSHFTVLDGDKLEPIARLPSRFALHGGPKYSPDGRFVYFASRHGWITKFDMWSLKVVAETRAGINTRNLAISGDGRVVMVANYLPHTLVILSADDLSLLKVIDVTDRSGKNSSRVSAVYQAEPRDSFIVALKDVPELWVINWTENPPPVYKGFVHSYQPGMIEGLAEKGPFPIQRIELSQPLDDFFFDPSYTHVLGSARNGGKAVVLNLDVRREIAEIPLPGLPHLGSGITWDWNGTPVIATPDLKEGAVSIIDMKNWKLIKKIPTLGPGFFMRSHENTPYAWVDNSFSKARDTLQIIDKNKLEVVAQLTPEPGKTASHVEFTRDGKYALISVAEEDGWLVVYDAATLKEVKRLPMKKPSGKYNVFNKITRSQGTSH